MEPEQLKEARSVKIASLQNLECIGGTALLMRGLQDKKISLTFYDELGDETVKNIFTEKYDAYVFIGHAKNDMDRTLTIGKNIPAQCYEIASLFRDMRMFSHLAALGTENENPKVKEYSGILHACSCMNRPSLGVSACFSEDLKKEAVQLLTAYKASLLKAIEWFKEHRLTAHVLENERVLLINAKDKISHRIIETLSSLMLESVYGGLYLGMMARHDDKAKIIIKGKGNLEEVAKEIFSPFTSSFEIRNNVLFSVISSDQEDRFMEHMKRILDKHSLEEEINL